MGKVLWASALSVLAMTSNATADANPGWVVLKVSRVQVAPDRADGSPWDQKKAEEPNGCPAVGALAAVAFGPAGGPVATFLCLQSGTKQSERDPRAPDLFVQVSIGDTKFRTGVAPDTFSEAFDFPIAVPLDAVPPAGVEIRVQDLDRDVSAGELIGLVRVTKQQLQDALNAGNPVLSLSDDRVKRLEVEVAPYELPKETPPFRYAVNQNPLATSVRARAGELVTISAQGTYSVRSNNEQIDPSGYTNGAKSSYNRKEFEKANHAGALAYIGAPNELHSSVFVGSCVSMVTPVPGQIFVAVNDTDIGNNAGSVEFTSKVSLPTLDQWRAGGGALCTNAPPEPAVESGNSAGGRIAVSDRQTFDESTLTPDMVLAKIQAAYMAGVKRCYKEYLKRDATARGKVTLSLTVSDTGRTTKGTARGFSNEVDECIGGLMGSWRFPIPKDKDGNPTSGAFAISLKLEP